MFRTSKLSGGRAVVNVTDVVKNYVAVWNEPDADERRGRIRATWAPDGTTCYRLLDARGHEAIEARVTGSWDKWLREGKYVFQPASVVCHHDVVKFDWVMVSVPGGEVEARGLSFLLLDTDGRIKHDYQFNPTANEVSELVQRYVAIRNESDAQVRRRQIAELWAPDGSHISEASVRNGHGAIDAEFHGYVAKGLVFSSPNMSQTHHHVAWLAWRMQTQGSGENGAVGSNLLVLDDRGQIRLDVQFREPIALSGELP